MIHHITGKEKSILTALIVTLFVTACSSPSEPVQDVIADAVSSESSSSISSEATSSEKELSSESESPSSLSSYISEVSSSESSQTETSETSSEDISSSSDVEATVKAEEIRAAEKAKQEEELRIQQAEQEKARQEAEAALKVEQEKAAANSSQAEKPSTPAEKPAEKPAEQPTQSEPQSVEQQSGKYAVNEYGNPSMEVLRSGVKINVNPADPELQKALGGRGTLDPNVKIPNPWASMQPISPYIGQANPPAGWAKPTPQGHGEYKWSPEAGCWRYYNGKASDKYVSIYGIETWAQSKLEKSNPGASVLKEYSSAHSMGIYGV